ncbi:MAG: hypothetical protein E7124_07005 [Bacteroidales bacterium]|nr:hypothetical protein [Bacteroidales bacterium]
MKSLIVSLLLVSGAVIDTVYIMASPSDTDYKTIFGYMADENSSSVIDCDVYNEGMKLIHNGKDKEALKYFTKKLKKDEVEWKDREHLNYQLAHYYLFGIFDPYYNGFPSKISRVGTKVKNLNKGMEHLAKSNYKCRGILHSVPSYPSYSQEETIRDILNKDEVGEDFQNAVISMAFFSGEVCKVNPMEMWVEDMMNNSNEQICDEHVRRIAWYSSLYPYIFSSSAKHVSMPEDVNKGADYLYEMGKVAYDSGKYYEAAYLFVRAALFGYAEGWKMMILCSQESVKIRLEREVSKKTLRTSYRYDYLFNDLMELGLKDIEKYDEFEPYKELTKAYIQIYKAKADDAVAEWDAVDRRKQARRHQRLMNFANFLQSAAQATGVAMAQSYGFFPSMSVNANLTTAQNLNYLLDPNYTLFQYQQKQQYWANLNQQFMQSAFANVRQAEYQEYQLARQGYQQMGRDLTLEEFRQNQAQAMMMDKQNEEPTSSSAGGSYSPIQTYQRYEKLAESIYNSLTIGGGTVVDESGESSGVAGEMWQYGGSYSTMKMNFNDAQKQMRRVRQEAAAMGIHIAPSKWETMTISM